jgi:hypothetical protein
MDKIYKRAEMVDIWLGKCDEGIDAPRSLIMILGMSALSDVVKNNSLADIPLLSAAQDPNNTAALAYYGLPPLKEENWAGIMGLFERAWSYRTWVVQEVALAREANVLWGPITFGWSDLSNCCEFMNIVGLSLALRLGQHSTDISRESMAMRGLSVEPDHPPDIQTGIGATLDDIHQIRTLCQGGVRNLHEFTRLTTSMQQLAGFGQTRETAAHLLLLVLIFGLNLQVTDCRDRIFGFLGLVNSLAEQRGLPKLRIRPRYADSTPESVLTEAATVMIEDCNHVGIITMINDDSVKKLKDLPSWVPEFTLLGPHPVAVTHTPFNRVAFESFDASRYKSLGQRGVRVDGDRLHVKASRVGAICDRSDSSWIDVFTLGKVEELAAFVLDCAEKYPLTGQNRVELLWRTLIFDIDKQDRPASADLRESFRWLLTYVAIGGLQRLAKSVHPEADRPRFITERLRGMTSLSRLAETDDTGTIPSIDYLDTCCRKLDSIPDARFGDDDALELIRGLMYGKVAYETVAAGIWPYRRLFRTADMMLGNGPQSVEVGDTLWVVSSCPVPIVLRTHPDEPGCFKLVGEAYIHGIMHGEAVKDDTEWTDVCIR